MIDDLELKRTWAVQRYFNGEKPETICASLGCSKAWLYKWVNRCLEGDPFWVESRSRRPLVHLMHTAPEIEEIVKLVRLNLYNQDLFCGAQAISWEMEDLGVQPLPSLRTINRILSRQGLTHRRTGRYEPKGTAVSETALPDAESNPSGRLGWSVLSNGPPTLFIASMLAPTRLRSGADCTLRSPRPASRL